MEKHTIRFDGNYYYVVATYELDLLEQLINADTHELTDGGLEWLRERKFVDLEELTFEKPKLSR